MGGLEREIRVAVDADRLRATGTSIRQVAAALARQNVEYPGGRLKDGMSEQMLRTLGRIQSVGDFARVIVSAYDGLRLTVEDLSRVEDGVKEPRSLSRWDGRSAVSLVIRKQSGQNTIQVVDRLTERLSQIRATLPPGVNLIVTRDLSLFIREAVHTVESISSSAGCARRWSCFSSSARSARR